MAIGCNIRVGVRKSETYPLLMDHNTQASDMNHDTQAGQHDHIVCALPDTSKRSSECTSSYSREMPSSPPGNVTIAIDPPSMLSPSISSPAHQASSALNSLGRSASTSSHSYLIPAERSFQSSSHDSDSGRQGTRQRIHPLNTKLWLSIDAAVTVTQILAAIIVLCLFRNEEPRAPLGLWVIGYAGGCLALLPLICWRYKYNHPQQQDPDTLAPSLNSSTIAPSSQGTLPSHTSQQDVELEGDLPDGGRAGQLRAYRRTALYMDRFKIALDCFFAVWFVIGNVWVFGDHTSSHDAPNLYRLCMFFLAFSCISYAMPFVVCATLCCCLPCIMTFLNYGEERTQAKGAKPEVIAGLPIYKFKTTGSSGQVCKDVEDSDCESHGEGGIFAPGTDKERLVSQEDAVCCICLGYYKDGVDLKELSCSHFFHVECVDKWLEINATCPFCKQELSGSSCSSNDNLST